jgi:segregation and condensation protein B
MSIKGKIEAIIYAAEEPITFVQITALLQDYVRQEIEQQRRSISEAAQAVAQAEEQQPGPIELPVEDSIEPVDHGSTSDQEASLAESQTSSEPAPATDAEVKSAIRQALDETVAAYSSPDRGVEIRQVAGGYRMATKAEHHDLVRTFAKGLKPPVRLSLASLETLAVIAYKQPVTAPEISEIRGVDCSGVLGTLLDRKLITTAGRKAVIGRPILYKTTKEFLLRFGLKDVNELPSMEEFEKMAQDSLAADLFAQPESEAPEVPAEPPPQSTEEA